MRQFRFILPLVGIWLIAFPCAASADDAPVTPEQAEFFEKKIRPVLADRCWKCHGSEKEEGNLRLDRYARVRKGGDTGPAVVPGDLQTSELVEAILYDPAGYQMPPDGKLPQSQIDDLLAWIKIGAPWPGADTEDDAAATAEFDLAARAKHWSYQPIVAQAIPDVRQPDWVRTPVDAFLLKSIESANLAPAAPADRRTLLRRLALDVTGLPPTEAEIEEFVADKHPDAYERLVERLLAAPAYGERWGRHWLDLVRFAETAGHEFDYEIEHAWRYRDYIVRAFNDDLPYDQLLIEHLAGDLLEAPRRDPVTGRNESILATGFYWFSQGKHSPVDIRAEECDTVDNQLDVIGRAFLGTSIACARCHDHKFDPIRAADYYALAGFLQSSRRDAAQIDPPERTSVLVDEIRDARARSEFLLSDIAASGFYAIENEFAERLANASAEWLKDQQAAGWPKYLSETVIPNPQHPLYLWGHLGHIADENTFRERKRGLHQEWNQRAAEAVFHDSTRLFEDFTGDEFGELPGWFTSGPAWIRSITRGGEYAISDSPDAPIRHLWEPGTVNSGLNGAQWQGTLRSPTFTIEQNNIWYRVRKIGGESNNGRKHKSGQIHLVVDGFQLIQNPLYGMLSLNVPTNGEYVWLRQDVSKFPGHAAYIEFEDHDDGILIVDRIVFSNANVPPEIPDSLQRALLDDPEIDSPAKLAAAYQQNLKDTLATWSRGTLALDDHLAARTALANFLLTSNLLPVQPKFADEDERAAVASALERLRGLQAQILPPTYALAITDGTPENERILIRGQHTKPGESVPRRFLEVFEARSDSLSETSSGRLELAERFVRGNPLAARVIVNRLWHHHFGTGLVATVDDFGHMGQPPSHPELLDWLANELIARGWSLKAIHRLMLLSNAYRMSSEIADLEAETADPQNRLLHRMNLKRLEGEVLRDAMLALSGRLDRRLYGESVMPHLTSFMEGRGRPGQSGPLDGDGRRSIYINVRRNFLTPMFLAFDFPTPFTTMGRRSVSNVPAQGLTLMNNEFVLQQSRLWAERLLVETADWNGDPAEQRAFRVGKLYEQAFARQPTANEQAVAAEFLDQQAHEYGRPDHPQAWTDLCHVLLNVKEFVYVR